MSIFQDCLDNIIGLSRTTCPCFALSTDESKSGLYLDELEGMSLKLAESLDDCENGSLWDILNRARENATKDFKSYLMAALMERNKFKRQPFSGVIGSEKFKNNLAQTKTFAGLRIYCTNIIGGTIRIKRIGLVFDSNSTFDIEIRSNLNDDVIATYTVTSQANRLAWFNLPAPLNLEMNQNSFENPQYYITYQTVGKQAKDITAGCGCGSGHYKYYWNTSNPIFKSYEKDRWAEYIMLTGTEGDDISERENWGTSNYLQGLILDAEFRCRVNDLICKEELDFEGNPLAIVMAHAIRLRAGSLVNDSILAMTSPNRITMTDRERLMGKKNTYLKEYKDRVAYLAENINIQANDCLICNDFGDVIKGGIFN